MKKWALVSDIHIPYHNKRHLDLWFDFIRWWKPDVVEIVGDYDDAPCVSKYADGTAKEHSDLIYTYAPLVQDLLRDIRSALPDAEIALHAGNHEARVNNYISSKAPALQGLITAETLWKTDTYGVDCYSYEDPPVKRYGKFYVHHGIYAAKGGGNSVRKMTEEFGVSIISGHTHRQAIVSQSFELTGEVRTGIELGHLTDIHSKGMSYTNLRDWQSGFGYAYIEKDEVFPFLVSISDNMAVADGHLFKA